MGVQIVVYTSYLVPSILQETGWEVFTIRAEEESIVKVICFFLCTCGFLFYFILLWYCVPVSSVVSSVGTAFSMKIWWRHDMYILLYFLYALLLYLVPGCWRTYVVPVVSSSVCVLHNKPFYPMQFRWAVRTYERTKGRSSVRDVQLGWQLE